MNPKEGGKGEDQETAGKGTWSGNPGDGIHLESTRESGLGPGPLRLLVAYITSG